MKKCPPSIRLADLREEHGKDNHQHQAAARPLHRRGLARPASAGQSSPHFRDWRGHSSCGRQCGHLLGRPIHGRRAGRSAHSNLSRTKRTMFQRLGAASRAQEAPASLDCFVRRVRCEQRLGEFGPNSAGKLGKPIRLGLHRPYSRNPRLARLGRLVRGRTENAPRDHACARHRI